MNIWGWLFLLVGCPLLGGLPIIDWLVRGTTGQKLAQVGTGNISVSAAFYHGGAGLGSLAVLSEALKGSGAVLLTRYFFPETPAWELVALCLLVLGRFAWGRGAGTTNAFWGCLAHEPVTTGLTLLIGGISFTLFRQRQQGRIVVLILFPLLLSLRHSLDHPRIVAAIALASLLALIYQCIPDDLNLPTTQAQSDSQKMFRFFRGDRAILTLNHPLKASEVGAKAATLSQLRRQGYPVPTGWVLPPGDDPEPLLQILHPTPTAPLIVRSSAIGEDSQQASAAGQYLSIGNVTNSRELQQAIHECLTSYSKASQYRDDHGVEDTAMAVLIQPQIAGVWSGVAFSRDPVSRQGDRVVIEALSGGASRVVSGQFTPEQYQVEGLDEVLGLTPKQSHHSVVQTWELPSNLDLLLEGTGDAPQEIIRQVAFLSRHLERFFQGVPQDIEWTYDGQYLWLLQSRPITTLLPIWTRKIAAEVIPGAIRPLTWSINQPLTCGVWGQLFRVVLGQKRAQGLNFNETATLHHSWAYFNASLLGDLFRRMGLPPESLEFLTRGASFSKPPLSSTLRNLPGLFRLLLREWRLEGDFTQLYRERFSPVLANLNQEPPDSLDPPGLLGRIHSILETLEQVTYFSILAPLSAALRQAIFRVTEEDVDRSQVPEVAALRSLQELALATRNLLSETDLSHLTPHSATLFVKLAEQADGETVLTQFNQLIDRYGYLSEVATDIAVPRWREDPQPMRELFSQCLFMPPPLVCALPISRLYWMRRWRVWEVQRRVTLQGQVGTVYNQLLAELRGSFVALERQWVQSGLLHGTGDIFFLTFEEIQQCVNGEQGGQQGTVFPQPVTQITEQISGRRSQWEQDRQLTPVPYLLYGPTPPRTAIRMSPTPTGRLLRGIGASPGCAEGTVKVIHHLDTLGTTTDINRETILVVPFTDAGWAPVLARAGGIVAEVGGRLSHGAIVAREYGIPAVMDIAFATQRLQDGQRVWIDGEKGTVEIV